MAIKPLQGVQFGIDDATDELVLVDSRDDTVLMRWATTDVTLDAGRNLELSQDTGEEVQIELGVNETWVGTTDAVTYTNPKFRMGRMVNGPYGPQFRLVYEDDDHTEKAVIVWERSGTFAVSRDTGDPGSCFEAFYGFLETYPIFRLGSSNDGHYLQFRHPTSDADDYFTMRRDGANDTMQFYDDAGVMGTLDFSNWKNSSTGTLALAGTIFNSFYAPTVGAVTAFAANAYSGNLMLFDLTSTTGNVTVTLNYPVQGERFLILVYQHATARTITWQHELGAGPAAVTVLEEGGTAYAGTNSGRDFIELLYAGGTTYYAEYRYDYK